MGSFNEQKLQDFIGKGITFPLELDSKGSAVVKSGWPVLKSSVAIILAWSIGTRYFLPEFGSLIHNLIDEPNDDTTKNLLVTFLDDTISRWEKRVEVVDIEMSEPSIGKRQLTLTLRIVNTQKTDNFVWPFYNEIIY